MAIKNEVPLYPGHPFAGRRAVVPAAAVPVTIEARKKRVDSKRHVLQLALYEEITAVEMRQLARWLFEIVGNPDEKARDRILAAEAIHRMVIGDESVTAAQREEALAQECSPLLAAWKDILGEDEPTDETPAPEAAP